MFTGIVTDIGVVRALQPGPGLLRVSLDCGYDPDDVAIGASIAHAGCCLTVIAKAPGQDGHGMRYDVEIASESLAVTRLGDLQIGDRLNLERSLKLGEELGGHLASAHVDGLGLVRDVREDGAGHRLRIAAPEALAPLIAPKGSILVEGVSLTVNEVDGPEFGVMIIPHTWKMTTLCDLRIGARVHLEADLLARYVARILAVQRGIT